MTIDSISNTFFLFQNQTTDDVSDAVVVKYPNKTAIVKMWGDWLGAVIKVQTSAPQSSPETWIDVPATSGNTMEFTDDTQSTLLYLVQNEKIRASLSGAVMGTSINVSVEIF